MSNNVYEVVGAIDRGAADVLPDPEGGTIFVNDGDSEYLIAQPKEDSDGEQ